MTFPRGLSAKLAAATMLLSVGACDCDERLRRALSDDPTDRRMPTTPDATSGPSESEPNDEPSNGSAIVVGEELREVRGKISRAEDVDWFTLTARADENLEITVAPETMLDVVLEVAVPDSAALTYDNGRRGDPETVPVLKAGSRPQRFAVRPVGGATGSYVIRFRRRMADASLEAEPNDDTSVATEFALPGELQGQYDRPGDRDVYVLRGVPQQPFELEFGPLAGARQIVRVFRDAALAEPLLTLQVSEDAPMRIPNLAIDETGETYVVVSAVGTAPRDRPYELRATSHPPLDDAILELEPNDVTGMELALATGWSELAIRGYLHAADDVDRFKLTGSPAQPVAKPPKDPAAGQEGELPLNPLLQPYLDKKGPTRPIAATLTWSNEAETFGLEWTTHDGTRAEFRRDSQETKVAACGMSLDDGPATVAVRAERITAAPRTGEPQYTLTFTDLSSSSAWEAEPNGTTRNADALVDARRGTFGQYEDVDAFAFAVTAEQDASRTVAIEAQARGTDLVLRILDDGGGVVANLDNAPIGGAERAELDLPAGLYFAELRWKGGSLCEPYQLTVTQR